MTRSTRYATFLLGPVLASLCGCLTAAIDDAERDDVGVSTQAVFNVRARIFYFSDDTYSTRVGSYFQNCSANPSHSGTTTAFTSGYVETCDFSYRYGCYAYLASGPACPLQYESCVDCTGY